MCIGMELELRCGVDENKNPSIPVGKYICFQKVYWSSRVQQKVLQDSEMS